MAEQLKEEIRKLHRHNRDYLANHLNDEEARRKYQQSLKLLLETHTFERKK
jgi:hypothetical protein